MGNAMLHNVSMDFGCRTCPGDVWHTSKNLWKQLLRDIVPCSANWRKELLQYTHSIHVWYIIPILPWNPNTWRYKYTIHGCYTFSLHQSFCSVVLKGCACIRRSSSAIFPPSVQKLQKFPTSDLPSPVDGWTPVSLYHLGCIKPFKWLDTLPMTWYKIALPSLFLTQWGGGDWLMPTFHLFFSTYITHTIHLCYISLHLLEFYGKCR